MNKLYQILASIINPKAKSVDKKIVIGTIVHLKSGGFNMTVQDIAIGDKYVNNEVYIEKEIFYVDGLQKMAYTMKNGFQRILLNQISLSKPISY
jgi:uncharacterized protein YodC (DUF2158 family)